MRLNFYKLAISVLFFALPVGVVAIALTKPTDSKALIAILAFLLSLTTGLGFYKYLIEPHWIALDLRQRFATGLWIACYELEQQLNEITVQVHENGNEDFQDALLKIPNNDWGDRIDWFTKTGYYTSITVYKIAAVSAWLSIYRQSLLLSAVSESREFLSILYERADEVAREFSDESIFWRDYFYAIGDKIIDSEKEIPKPISFATYCQRSAESEEFRLFFEQVHMYFYFVSKERASLKPITIALDKLRSALDKRNLVEGLKLSPLATSLATRNLYQSPASSAPPVANRTS